MKYLNKFVVINFNLILFFIILFLTVPVYSEVITQFVPSLSISEEYTDNYNQTQNNEEDEFSTIYGVGFSFGIIGKKASLFLDYNPEYTDYIDHNEDDTWSHALSINGQSQISKHATLSFSEDYERDLSRTPRTNSLERHDTNTTSVGMVYEFGPRDSFGLNYTFSFDDYEDPNADEYTSYNPSASLSYWFTPLFGFDLGAAYEKTEYDISSDEPETWSGNIRFLKSITKHFDAYISYAHTLTDQASGNHTIYNPSIGFDWQATEDSGISIGIGVLLQEWDNQNYNDSEDFFIDLDVYKTFDFSRKGTLSLTGSSGYTPSSEDAASLGFEIYYQAGALLTYRLTRHLTSDLNTSYQISQYDEPGVNRQDNTLQLGAGLSWVPLQWMTVNLSYLFSDFDTDSSLREEYQENVGTLTIRLTPSRPVRFDSSNPRTILEDRLFQ